MEMTRVGAAGAIAMALGAAVASFSPAIARADVESDSQVWHQVIVQPKLGSGFKGYFELQTRYSQDMTRLDRALLRPALNYEFSKGWTAWLGYLWQPVYFPAFVGEQRLWQQAQNDWKDGDRWWVQNRLRFEERFIPGLDTAYRLRYLLRGLKQVGESSWYAVASDEIFLNLNSVASAGPRSGIDQNRLFGGIHYKASDQLRIEGGYMFNVVNRPEPLQDRFNHNLVLTLFVSPGAGPSPSEASITRD